MKIIVFILFTLFVSLGIAQDELSSEIDKLESGDVEESAVVTDPNQSAQEIEQELQTTQEGEAFQEAAPPAPETLPEDIEAIAPQEEIEDPQQPAFEEVPPAPENLEDTLSPVEEEIAAPEEVVPEVPAAQESEPQFADAGAAVPSDFENRLNRIYEQFYKEATADDVWAQIVGDKISESYTIQPGDTLWDVSQTFFGNGHYWPKVWQVNDTITNPHNIEPGFSIQFIQGNPNQAPQINIVKEEGEQQPATGSVAQLEDPNTPRPEAVPVIPPPSRKSPPVLQNLPPSLPFIKGPNFAGYDKQGFAVDRKNIAVAPSTVYVTSYISEDAPVTQGKIIDHDEEDRGQAALFDLIYIQTDDPVSIGEKMVVFNIGQKVMSIEDDSYIGKQVHMLGEIRIQSLINAEENVYKAIVVKAISQLSTGSYVAKGNLIVTDITETGSSSSVSANVVGGEFDPVRFHVGMHEIVYLDKGREAGFREGQILSILRNPQVRNKSSIIQDLSQQIAKVKIVKTTNSLSTGVVLSPKDDIRKGDIVGPLRKQAMNTGGEEDLEEIDNPVEQNSDEEMDSGLEESEDEFIEGE